MVLYIQSPVAQEASVTVTDLIALLPDDRGLRAMLVICTYFGGLSIFFSLELFLAVCLIRAFSPLKNFPNPTN